MYNVFIRNNVTGEIRKCEMDTEWDDGDGGWGGSLSWWTDGNMSCDCNREILWSAACGDEANEDIPCGHDRFTALYAELPDGRKIPIEQA